MCGTVCLSTTENILNDDGGAAFTVAMRWLLSRFGFFFIVAPINAREHEVRMSARKWFHHPTTKQLWCCCCCAMRIENWIFFLWSLEGHGHINLPYIYTSSIHMYVCATRLQHYTLIRFYVYKVYASILKVSIAAMFVLFALLSSRL